jgi:hypothetical protein
MAQTAVASAKEPKPMSSPLSDVLSRTIAVEHDPDRGFALGVYGEALEAAFGAFESAGAYGNGPTWLALAEYLVSTKPSIDGLDWDDCSDAFYAYVQVARPWRSCECSSSRRWALKLDLGKPSLLHAKPVSDMATSELDRGAGQRSSVFAAGGSAASEASVTPHRR